MRKPHKKMILHSSPRIRRTDASIRRARGSRKQYFDATIHRSQKGYAVVLLHPNRVQPLLTESGTQLMRWQRLDAALAFLTERYGIPRAVRLNLGE